MTGGTRRVLAPEELSLAQERVLFYDLLAPEAAFHGVPRLMKIEGELRTDLLERALNEVIARHEVLRTHYEVAGSGWRAEVVPEERISVTRWRDGAAVDDPGLDELIADLVARPFDVANGPVIRAHVLAHTPRECLLLLDFHHVACDGWSERIVVNEFTELYEAYSQNRDPVLPVLPLQYREYAAQQRSRLRSPAMASHHAYWRRQLGAGTPAISLPFDRERQGAPTYRGSSLGYELDAALADQLRTWSADRGFTTYMTMLAAYFLLLHKWTGDRDVVIGSPINNREHRQVHDVVGYFVTRLPLRSRFVPEHSVEDFVRSVRRTVLEAVKHKETTADRWPYPRDDSEVRNSSNYQVMFFYQENPVGVRRTFAGLTLTNANSHSPGRVEKMGLRSPTLGSQLDLGFFVEPVGDRVFGWIEYAIDVFDRPTVGRLMRSYLACLREIVSSGEQPLSEIDLPAPAGNPVPAGQRSLVEELARSSASSPDATAVIDEQGRTWTFKDLDELTDGAAEQIVSSCAGGTVALRMERSFAHIVALVGLLKAGKVCLLLDPRHPDEYARQAAAAADCTETVGVETPGTETVTLEFGRRAPAPPSVRQPEQALVLPTTGTTGEPKLVVVDHESAMVGQTPADAHYRLDPQDVFVVTSPPASARILGELFWPWLSGSAVLVTPAEALSARDLTGLAARHGGTAISMLPSMLAAVLDDSEATRQAAGLKLIQTLGEPLPSDLYRRAADALSADILNCYGQTEAFAPLYSQPGAEPPDGCLTVPLQAETSSGAKAQVVDENGDSVGIGEVGALLLAGRHIANGYLGVPADAQDVFKRGKNGERFLDTKHRARRLADGQVELLGRDDNRVKVNGYSVSLDEVEAVLRAMPDVLDAHARVSETSSEAVLQADVVGDRISLDEVRRRMRERLPAYMVPTVFRHVETIARGITGKVDRRRPGPAAESPSGDAGQRTALRIAEIFRALLGTPEVEKSNDFFQIGGNSLLAIRAVSQINERLGVSVSLRDLLELRSPEAIAAKVED